jgi:hypothetical protein
MQRHPIANHRGSLPRSFFSLFALALATVLLANAKAAISTIPAPTPLWEIDLSKFGYEPRPPESREADVTHRFNWPTRQTITFTQEDLLAVSFETHPESSELSTRKNPLPTDPYHLVTEFLNAKDGTVVRQGDWPVRTTDRTFFFPAQNGQFVVGMGTTLYLYSPDLKIATQRTLSASWGNLLMVGSSPTADTFMAFYSGYEEARYAPTLDLIDSTSLKTLKSWTGDRAQPGWALWGDELARFSLAGSTEIETITTAPRDVPSSVPAECHHGTFVNQDTLAVSTYAHNGCNNLALISTEGKFIQQLRLEEKALVGPARPSRNGRYFLVESFASQRPPWKIFVQVFALGTETPVLVMALPPGPSDGFWGVPSDSPAT